VQERNARSNKYAKAVAEQILVGVAEHSQADERWLSGAGLSRRVVTHLFFIPACVRQGFWHQNRDQRRAFFPPLAKTSDSEGEILQ